VFDALNFLFNFFFFVGADVCGGCAGPLTHPKGQAEGSDKTKPINGLSMCGNVFCKLRDIWLPRDIIAGVSIPYR
jgi:hypothetical protein